MDELPNQTIVEIGPETNPVFELFGNESLESIGRDSTYVAIGCDSDEIQRFKNHYGQKGYALQGDVRYIPLKNESAD